MWKEPTLFTGNVYPIVRLLKRRNDPSSIAHECRLNAPVLSIGCQILALAFSADRRSGATPYTLLLLIQIRDSPVAWSIFLQRSFISPSIFELGEYELVNSILLAL